MISGYIKTISELQSVVDSFVTSSALHGANAWVKLNEQAYPYGTTYKAKTGVRDGEYAFISMATQTFDTNYFENWSINQGNNPILFPTYNINYPRYNTRCTGFSGKVNILNNTSTVFMATIHKQFMENLGMFEQGGVYKTKCKGYIPQARYFTQSGLLSGVVTDYNLPDFADCASIGTYSNYIGNIKYYMYLKNANLTIVLAFRENGLDFYQTFSIGLLDAVDKNTYIFPAYFYSPKYLNTKIYHKEVNTSGIVQAIGGYVLDYRHDIQSMSNSNAVNSTAPVTEYGKMPSNLKVMLPSGEWVDVYNFTQGFSYYTVDSSASYYVKDIRLSSLRREKGDYFLSPCEASGLNYSPVLNNRNTYLHRPLICANTSSFSGILGSIPLHYLVPSEIEYGEYPEYLSVPNGWKNRISIYPHAQDDNSNHSSYLNIQKNTPRNTLVIKED